MAEMPKRIDVLGASAGTYETREKVNEIVRKMNALIEVVNRGRTNRRQGMDEVADADELTPATPQWMAAHRLRSIERREDEWGIHYVLHGEDDLHALYVFDRALLNRYGKNPFEMTTFEVLANEIAEERRLRAVQERTEA